MISRKLPTATSFGAPRIEDEARQCVAITPGRLMLVINEWVSRRHAAGEISSRAPTATAAPREAEKAARALQPASTTSSVV